MKEIVKRRAKFLIAMRNTLKVIDYMSYDEKAYLYDIYTQIRRNDKDDYVSISSEKGFMISYGKKSCMDNSKRTRVKISRYIMRNFEKANEVRDHLLQKFWIDVTKCFWNKFSEIEKNVKISDGKEITRLYRYDFASSSHSCMTGDCWRCITMYEMNPEQIKILTYKGYRCLMWYHPDGDVIMDRIYPPDTSETINDLNSWAEQKGYYYRQNDGYLSNDKQYKFTLKYDDTLPYMDTFARVLDYTEDKNEITISNKGDCDFSLYDTNGCLPWEGNTICCYECNTRISIDDSYCLNDEYYCEDCRDEYFGWCEHCEEYIARDECSYVSSLEMTICDHCLENNYIKCADCDEWFDDSDVTESKSGDYVCDSCIEENYYVCEYCNLCVLKDESHEIDEEIYCTDCADELFKKCVECDNYITKYDEIKVNGTKDYVCQECEFNYTICLDCKKHFNEEDMIDINGENVCYQCASENYFIIEGEFKKKAKERSLIII